MIRRFFHTSIITIFLIVSLVVEAKEKNSMPDLYFLAVNSNSIYTTVLLNDVPLIDLRDGSSVMNETPVAGWLIPGSNTLKLVVRAAPEKERITGDVSASIYLHDNTSDVPKPLKVLAEIRFPNEDSDPDKKLDTVERVFEFSGDTKARLWSEAQSISSINEGDKSEMLSLVEALGNAIIKGDIDKAIELQKYKIMDDAIIEGDSPEDIEMVVKANYNWLQSQEGIALHHYNSNEVEYSLMAHDKVVKLTKNSGEEILQLESSDLFFEIPVFVSKINGAWKIVR
jgi:hypothetical protein